MATPHNDEQRRHGRKGTRESSEVRLAVAMTSGTGRVYLIPGTTFTTKRLVSLLIIVALAISSVIPALSQAAFEVTGGLSRHMHIPEESTRMGANPARHPSAKPCGHDCDCRDGDCKHALACHACMTVPHINVPLSVESARLDGIQTTYFLPPAKQYATTTPSPGLRPPII